jgi:hypothetical protein
MKYIVSSSSFMNISIVYTEHQQQSCITTCLQCPSWVVATDPSTFWVSSHDCWHRSTVMCVWIFLPFLRGTRVRDDNYYYYGLLRVSKTRLLGICGAPDDGDDYEESVRHLRLRQGRQVYGHLENQRSSMVLQLQIL